MRTKSIALCVLAAAFLLIAGGLIWRTWRTVTIGVIYSPDTAIGAEANLAARYYRTRFPTANGRPVKFVFQTPALAEPDIVQAYRELEAQNVSLILGGGVSQAGIILAREAKRSGIPTIGTTASSQSLSERPDNFYNLAMDNDRQVQGSTRYLTKLGISRLAIVPHVENTAYTDVYAALLESYFAGESAVFPFDPEGGLYDRLHAFGPDAVFLILPAPALLRFLKQSRLSQHVTIISSGWGFTFPQYAPPLTRKLLISTQNGLARPEYVGLLRDFEAMYKRPATFSAEYVFSALNIMYQAIRAVGADRRRLNRYFSEPRIYDFVYGKLHLNEYGDAIHQYYHVYEFDQGAITLIDRFTMEDFPQP